MVRGFSYLVADVDWFSRRVLSHRVSITMEADCCVEALEEALAKRGKPANGRSHRSSYTTPRDTISSGSGAASNMRRSFREPRTALPLRAP